MNIWKDAFEIADIILEQSYVMWIIYGSFFVLALFVRKKNNKTRLHTGSVLLGFSIPGMLVSLACAGDFVYVMAVCIKAGSSLGKNKFLSDYPGIRELQYNCQGLPLTCFILSPILFGILAIVAVICGIVILKKRAGKSAGLITLIYGIALMGFTLWFTKGVFMFLSD